MKFFPLLLACLSPFLLHATPLLSSQDPVVGQVNGKKIHLSELEDKGINDLRIQLFEAVSRRLRSKALGLLAKTDPAFQKIPSAKVSDQQAHDFYRKNQLSKRGPFVQLKPQIVQYLRIQQLKAQVDQLYAQAIKQGKVKVMLTRPEVLLAEIGIETAYLWNHPKAKVMMMEFSDFQCPFCSRVQPTLEQIRREYKTKVLFGYRHYPLPFHAQAGVAAVAAECAREQGEFSTYHTLLFHHQHALQIKDLKKYARKIGIRDPQKFDRCLNSNKYKARVDHDIQVASSIGIRGTPSFLVGFYDPKTKRLRGEMVSGALPKAALTQLLDKYLAQ